jgi:hypothetical protein
MLYQTHYGFERRFFFLYFMDCQNLCSKYVTKWYSIMNLNLKTKNRMSAYINVDLYVLFVQIIVCILVLMLLNVHLLDSCNIYQNLTISKLYPLFHFSTSERDTQQKKKLTAK